MTPLTTWTLGVLIGYPVAALGLVAAVVVTALFWRDWQHEKREDDRYADETPKWLALAGVASILLSSVLITVFSYPWQPVYHSYRPVSGTVEQIDSRLLSGGSDSGPSQSFVVRIAGVDYRVDDTRAAALREGDTVSLSCIRTWQYAAAPGEVCRWGR